MAYDSYQTGYLKAFELFGDHEAEGVCCDAGDVLG